MDNETIFEDARRLTLFRLPDGKLVAPYQDEIELIAMDTIGSAENIYFDEIPITDGFSLIRRKFAEGDTTAKQKFLWWLVCKD